MERYDKSGVLDAWKLSWPKEFLSSRFFDRRSENEAYVDFLQRIRNDTSLNSSVDGYDEIGDDALSQSSSSNFDTELNAKYYDTDQKSEKTDQINIVESFMKGLEDSDRVLPYYDQVEIITSFCKGAKLKDLAAGSGKAKTTSLFCDVVEHKERKNKLVFRPLTSYELFEELRRDRYQIDPEWNQLEHLGKNLRLIYAPRPDASVILSIAATAPQSQAWALSNAIYNHLTFRNNLSVSVPSWGFKTFAFDLHLSYYAFQRRDECQTSGQRPNGTPLRQNFILPSNYIASTPELSTVPKSLNLECMQEAQFSMCLVGIDHSNWTVYAFDDGTFSEHHVGQHRERHGASDPIAASHLSPSDPIYNDPREYFLKVLEIQIRRILKEWRSAERWAKQEVQRMLIQPLAVTTNTNDILRRRGEWVNEMGKTLRILQNKLSEPIQSWETFRRGDIKYFLFEDERPNNSEPLRKSLATIDAVFSELQTCLANLDSQAKIITEIRLSVNTHLSFENHFSVVLQEKTAGRVRLLTLVTNILQFLIGFVLALISGHSLSNVAIPCGIVNAIVSSITLVGAITVLFLSWNKWCQWSQCLLRIVRRSLAYRIPSSNLRNINQSQCDIGSAQGHREAEPDIEAPMGTPGQKSAVSWSETLGLTSALGLGIPGEFANKQATMRAKIKNALNMSDLLPHLSYIDLSSILQHRKEGPIALSLTISGSGWPFDGIVHDYLKKLTAFILKQPSLRISQIRKVMRPKVEPGDRRIEWTCDCGADLYADFSHTEDSKIDSLLASLQSPGSTESYTSCTNSPQNTPDLVSTDSESSGEISTRSDSCNEDSKQKIERAKYTSTARPSEARAKFIALCINTGGIYKTLKEIDIRNINSDSELFRIIKEEYLKTRGFRNRFSFLIKPVTVEFVQFTLWDRRGGFVSVCNRPNSIPPAETFEYEYLPRPLTSLPPMPPEIFIHYLEHGQDDLSPVRNDWLPRFPKRLDKRVIDCDVASMGWGLHIIEGPNREGIFWISMATIVSSVIACVLWSILKEDVQGGAGLGALIVSLPPAILTAFLFRLGAV